MLPRIGFAVISAFTMLMATAASFEVKIVPSGDKFERSVGTSILFTCEVTAPWGSPQVRIQWMKNHREITTSGRLRVEQIGNLSKKLYITPIESQDAGAYRCIATSGSNRQEKSVELTSFKDITFDHVPNPQHPPVYTNALIECHVSGQPEPQVSWRYNDRDVDFGNRYHKEPKGLRIRNITVADDGNYTCRAEVESAGSYDERRITVVVHIPPTITVGPRNVEEVEGKKAMISCTARGLPPPKFEFYKDNREVMSSPDQRIMVDTLMGRIIFLQLKKEDEGRYTCKAFNDVGFSSSNGTLKVLVPPRIYELKNITKSEHDTAFLFCRSLGDPLPSMTFIKEGNRFSYQPGSNEEDRIIVSHSQGVLQLMIRNLKPSDAANYICKSFNSAGQDNKTGFVDVHYKPRFGPDHKKSVYSWAGTKHNITCHVQAQPLPTITWIRNRMPLENNDTFRIFDLGGYSSLQVRIKEADQSWIYGNYICLANNSQGREELTIALNRASVPGAPVDVKVKEVSPNQVVLMVYPPRENGGVRVIGYRVEFEGNILDVSVMGNLAFPTDNNIKPIGLLGSTEFSVDNLRPGTNYVFRVRGKNEVGVGSAFQFSAITANLTMPYPIKITSSRYTINANDYLVTWERPKTGGLPIKKYQFKFRGVKKNGAEGNVKQYHEWLEKEKTDNPDQPLLAYSLTGLEKQTEYQLQVIARNELGSSPPNTEFFFWTGLVGRSQSLMSCAGIAFGSFLSVAISTFAAHWILLIDRANI